MECDYPSTKRARFCSSDMEQPRSCHMAAAATHMPIDFGGKPVGAEVEMQDASFAQLDTAHHSDQHSRRKNAMPVLERFFLGLLTERDLYDRGVRLTQEQLQFYRRLKGGYY